MATLNVEELGTDGLDLTLTGAEAGGDEFASGRGYVVLVVENTDAADHTITIDSKAKSNFGQDVDPQVTVPAGETRYIGPFDPDRYHDPVSLTYDAVAGVNVGVFEVPEPAPDA